MPSRKKRPGSDSSFARGRVPKDPVPRIFGWTRFNLGARDIKRLFIYHWVVFASATMNTGGISRDENDGYPGNDRDWSSCRETFNPALG